VSKATILSIEDDENLQTVIRLFLEDQGYNVLSSNDGKTCLEKLQAVHVDVILLDLMLPDSDGLNLMMSIRQHSKAPIIVVSGKSDSTDKILGLELGADDYIGKPFEMRELYARIKSILRRVQAEPINNNDIGDSKKDAVKLGFAGWMLDRAAFRLTDDEGKIVELTTAEFKILEILLNSAGHVLSREKLFELALGHDYQSYDRAADIHIARLRKKLNENPKTPQMIKTIRGVGYMFCEEVTIISK
jgi:two-component system OmpR family response regulator